MNKFKIGDLVECVNDTMRELTAGKTYTVVDRSAGFITVVNDVGIRGVYIKTRFKKATVKYTKWQLADPGVVVPDNAVVSRAEDGSIVAFKVPVEPKVEMVSVYVGLYDDATKWLASTNYQRSDTHKITFDVVDGEPYLPSIRMEKL